MVRISLPIRRERYAALLILLAFFSGMVLTAATSGCDSARDGATAHSDKPLAEETNDFSRAQ